MTETMGVVDDASPYRPALVSREDIEYIARTIGRVLACAIVCRI